MCVETQSCRMLVDLRVLEGERELPVMLQFLTYWSQVTQVTEITQLKGG